MVWPEIDQVVKNHRYELILSGDKLDKYLEETTEIDENLWSISQLNFLELSNSIHLEVLSKNIGNLIHLSTLTLTSNRLKCLPEEISLLTSIRHFNVSNNQIEQLPDEIFTHLSQLETLNFSQNRLKILPKFSKEIHRKLSSMNLSHNGLVEFPFELENLSHLDLSSNQFDEFPLSILRCSNLKVLHFEENLLKEIPADLSTLHKLKEIDFKSNPLKDNRLKKLIEQEKIKATIEYLEKQLKSSSTSKHFLSTNRNESTSDETNGKYLIRILHFDQQNDSNAKQITILPSTTNLRRYFLSSIFLNLNLETEGNLKKFLTLQNELHDGICEKRTLASIGTHDCKSIKGNLVYDARDQNQIAFVPLGKSPKIVSAKEFYDQLVREAEQQRKLKKRNQISGLYKYLTLMENQTDFVFLQDEDRQIISIPPLTNADKTKLNSKSRQIFVEITSNHSMEICYRIMEMFIERIFRHDLVEKDPQSKFDQILLVQQTRTIDQNGKLKVTFPSRTDLQFSSSTNIEIERLFPSD